MDGQTIAVILIVLASAGYLVRKYARAVKSPSSGCGCGADCGCGCPADKKKLCGGNK